MPSADRHIAPLAGFTLLGLSLLACDPAPNGSLSLALNKSETREPAKAEPGTPPAEKPAPKNGPRIGAIAERAYIYRKPEAKGLPLGYIRMGTSAPLLSTETVKPEKTKDCPRGYLRVAPRGYVCLDPRKTTLDLHDPYFQALAEYAPNNDAAFPYKYAFSNGAPMYSRVPTKEEAEKAEREFGAPGSFVQLAEWSKGHEELIAKDKIEATDPVPTLFANEIGRASCRERVFLRV